MNVVKQGLGVGMHPPLNPGHITGRYSPPYRPPERMRCMTSSALTATAEALSSLPSTHLPSEMLLMDATHWQGNFFGGFDDGLLARAEALAAVDISKSPQHMMKHDGLYGHTAGDLGMHQSGPSRQQMQMHGPSSYGSSDSMLDQLSANSCMPLPGMSDHHNMNPVSSHHNHHQMYPPMYSHPNSMNHPHNMPPHHQVHHSMHDTDCDPRELEAFAERFKQRRIKLGVTQADVGNALANLKLPGVGCLSQSTICRFESLTLSHNNMIALKPILQTWLEEAEKVAREKKEAEQNGMMSASDKKRKRTSIAAPEKRSLEAYFAVQPRPSGEKIAQIAEKLDLKKNVVRVWFCNQRQKQKRMKFSAVSQH